MTFMILSDPNIQKNLQIIKRLPENYEAVPGQFRAARDPFTIRGFGGYITAINFIDSKGNQVSVSSDTNHNGSGEKYRGFSGSPKTDEACLASPGAE